MAERWAEHAQRLPGGCVGRLRHRHGELLQGLRDAGVTVNLAGGGPAGGNADSIVGFTNAVGTPFKDNIIGTDVNAGNSLKGGKGNDEISGNGGPDFVQGGAGKDNIRGGSGEDSLKGGTGGDVIRGSGGADNIHGQGGKDKCDGGGGNDIVKCEKKFKGKSPGRPSSSHCRGASRSPGDDEAVALRLHPELS